MKWLTEHDGVTGEEYIAVDTRGEALLRDPLTNKGTAFTEGERADLGLDGLVPPAVSTMDQQLARVSRTIVASRHRSSATSTSPACRTGTRRCSSVSSMTTSTR